MSVADAVAKGMEDANRKFPPDSMMHVDLRRPALETVLLFEAIHGTGQERYREYIIDQPVSKILERAHPPDGSAIVNRFWFHLNNERHSGLRVFRENPPHLES